MVNLTLDSGLVLVSPEDTPRPGYDLVVVDRNTGRPRVLPGGLDEAPLWRRALGLRQEPMTTLMVSRAPSHEHRFSDLLHLRDGEATVDVEVTLSFRVDDPARLAEVYRNDPVTRLQREASRLLRAVGQRYGARQLEGRADDLSQEVLHAEVVGVGDGRETLLQHLDDFAAELALRLKGVHIDWHPPKLLAKTHGDILAVGLERDLERVRAARQQETDNRDLLRAELHADAKRRDEFKSGAVAAALRGLTDPSAARALGEGIEELSRLSVSGGIPLLGPLGQRAPLLEGGGEAAPEARPPRWPWQTPLQESLEAVLSLAAVVTDEGLARRSVGRLLGALAAAVDSEGSVEEACTPLEAVFDELEAIDVLRSSRQRKSIVQIGDPSWLRERLGPAMGGGR